MRPLGVPLAHLGSTSHFSIPNKGLILKGERGSEVVETAWDIGSKSLDLYPGLCDLKQVAHPL